MEMSNEILHGVVLEETCNPVKYSQSETFLLFLMVNILNLIKAA